MAEPPLLLMENTIVEEILLRNDPRLIKLTIVRHGEMNDVRPLLERLASALRNNTRLTELRLLGEAVGIGHQGSQILADMLKKNNGIERLTLSAKNRVLQNKLSMLHFGPMLQFNRGIKELVLHSNRLDDLEVERLTNGLKTNKVVELIDLRANLIGPAGARALGMMLRRKEKVKVLLLGSDNIRYDGVKHLLSGMKHNLCLKNIDLSNNRLCDQSALLLGKFLATNDQLKELNVVSNDFSDNGMISIANGLKVNKALRRINIGYFEVTTVFKDGTACALGSALACNSTLQMIAMNSYRFSVEGLRAFLNGIGENKTLESTSMVDCEMHNEGATIMGNMLVKNHHIKSICLVGCSFGDIGCKGLARGLENTTSVTEVTLCKNSISDDGASVLGEMLKKNHFIEYCGLEHNNIGDRGAASLAKMLLLNKGLKVLNLMNNPILSPGRRAFVNGIMYNFTLTTLAIAYPHTHQEQNEIDFFIDMNRKGSRIFLRDHNIANVLWPKILAKTNLDTRFYLIQAKPELFQIQNKRRSCRKRRRPF